MQYLSSVALTNHPNLKMPSLNNIQPVNKKQEDKPKMDKQLLNKALGLEENADFTVVLNTIMNLREQKADLNNFVPKADYEVVLNSKNELEAKLKEIEIKHLQAEASAMIDSAIKNGQIAENSRNFYLDLCMQKDELEKVKQHLNSKPKLSETVLGNQSNKIPQTHSLTAEEIQVGKKMGHSIEELTKAKNINSKEGHASRLSDY